MILFGNPLNASVRKVLCCAALRSVELEQISILRGSDDPVFRAASPAGMIPALRDGTRSVIGSLPIIDYLDGFGAAEPIISPDRETRVEFSSVAQFADGPLAQVVSPIFQNRVFLPRFLGKPGNMQLVNRLLRGPLNKIMAATEIALSKVRGSDNIGIAEVSVFSQGLALLLSDQKIDSGSHPHIHKVMTRLLTDARLIPLISRNARLVGLELKAVTDLLGSEGWEVSKVSA